MGAPEASTEGIEARGEVSAVSDGAGHLEYLEHVRGVALRLRRRLLRGEGAAPRGFVVHVDVVVVVARLGILVNLASGRGGGGDGELGGAEARSSPRALARTRRWRARVRDRRRGRRRATGSAPAREADVRVQIVDGPNRPTPARSEANASARTTDARRLDANSRLRRMCSNARGAPRVAVCAG